MGKRMALGAPSVAPGKVLTQAPKGGGGSDGGPVANLTSHETGGGNVAKRTADSRPGKRSTATPIR